MAMWGGRIAFYDNDTDTVSYIPEMHRWRMGMGCMYGKKVVLQAEDWSLYVWQGPDSNEVTDVGAKGFYPKLGPAGLVFYSVPYPGEIYFYDGVVHRLTNDSMGDSDPIIGSRYIVWKHWTGNNTYGLRYYDMQSDTTADLTDQMPNGYVTNWSIIY
jgi:hypothetical protein